MKTLKELCRSHQKDGWPDKDIQHSYISIYEAILAPYRTGKKILEIGIFSGQSLRMWEEYFQGEVYGIDCSDQPHGGMVDLRPMIKEGTHNIIIMDAIDPVQVDKHFKGMLFDVIIDDASHHFEHQIMIYNNFKTYLAENGLYIIEDVQDIDKYEKEFLNIDPTKHVEVKDLRSLKGRYDDVLILIK